MLVKDMDNRFFEYSPLLIESNNIYKTNICICNFTDFKEGYDKIVDYLHPLELDYYNCLKYEKRIKSYLIGRFVAKKAVMGLIGEEDFKKIHIRNGIFNYPIVLCKSDFNIQVSITHCDDIAAAVAFTEDCSIGIDVEKISIESSNVLKRILSTNEKEQIQLLDIPYNELITLIWTAKESLSKIIRTGLTVPMDFFEIKKIDMIEKGYVCEFKNFTQYKSISYNIGEYMMSIVYPKRAEFYLDILKIKNDLKTSLKLKRV